MRTIILSLLLISLCEGQNPVEAVSKHSSLPVENINGIEYVAVPAGCYPMGNPFGDAYHIEMPVHEVCVNSFAIGTFSTTRGDFKRFVEESGYRTEAERGHGCHVYDGKEWKIDTAATWRTPGFPQGDDHPVVCVSWNDSVAYAQWLSRKSKRTFRLPTEAEWEYAARSGGRLEKFAGGNDVKVAAWYSENSDNRTHPVGQKMPNGLGLYDMSGNVWQWVQDWYGENYYRESPRRNPTGPSSGSKRVFRGGSWFYDPRGARTTYREFHLPGYSSSHVGFRLVSCA